MVITAQNTKIKPGYKQTEIGMIPKDWKIEKLGDCLLGMPQYGINAPAVRYTDSLPTYIRITDITDDSCFSPENIASVKYVGVDRYILKTDDLVFARTGASVGKTYLYKPEDGHLVFAGYLIRVKVNPSKLLPGYLAAYVKTEYYWSWVRVMSMRSGQPGINGTEYAQLPIPLPSLPEQQAIATVLSDIDSLITSLDKLIAKKRDIKQATMQQILTGKTRLPGFSGEWSSRLLSDVCWFQEGPGVRNTQFTRSGIKLLNGTNIYKGEVNLESTDRFISEKEAFGPYAHFLVDRGDIIIACSGITIDKFHEKVAFVKEAHLPLCMNTSTMRFKSFNDCLLAKFLYQLLMSDVFKKQIGSQATGSAQLNFGPSHVANVVFTLPELKEQEAIADILTDMDAEIAALEQRRDKTRALKQGMMQELLTGKTRLV